MRRVWPRLLMMFAIAVFAVAGPPIRAQQKTDQTAHAEKTPQEDDPAEATVQDATDAAKQSGLGLTDGDSTNEGPEDNGNYDPDDPSIRPPETDWDSLCKDFPNLRQCKSRQQPIEPVEKVQPELVIPLGGDSAPPPDEVMDGAWDAPPPLLSGPSADPVESLTRRPMSTAVTLKAALRVYDSYQNGTIRLRVFSPRGLSAQQRARLTTAQDVLQPLDEKAAPAIHSILEELAPRGSGVHVTSIVLRAFCVEAKKLSPLPATTFKRAGRAMQAQYAPARSVPRVAEFLARRGYFKPQGNAEAYGRSITQYAIWTKLERWDRARFTDELIRRSRDTATALHQPWTAESERTLRAFAPLRWKDVRLSILVADRLQTDARTKRGVL